MSHRPAPSTSSTSHQQMQKNQQRPQQKQNTNHHSHPQSSSSSSSSSSSPSPSIQNPHDNKKRTHPSPKVSFASPSPSSSSHSHNKKHKNKKLKGENFEKGNTKILHDFHDESDENDDDHDNDNDNDMNDDDDEDADINDNDEYLQNDDVNVEDVENEDSDDSSSTPIPPPPPAFLPTLFPNLGSQIAFSPQIYRDELLSSAQFFQWMIAPLPIDYFFTHIFEKRPMAILRSGEGEGKGEGKEGKKGEKEKGEKGGKAKITKNNNANPNELSVKFLTTRHPLVDYVGLKTYTHDDKPPNTPAETVTYTTSCTVDKGIPENHDPSATASSSPSSSSSSSSSSSPSSSSVSSSSPSPPPSHCFSNWFTKSDVFSLLSSPAHKLHYGVDVDITEYKDGKRYTLNPSSKERKKKEKMMGKMREKEMDKKKMTKAMGKDNDNEDDDDENDPADEESTGPVPISVDYIRPLYKRGASIRFLSPQQHNDRIARLCSLFDTFFSLQTSCNSYLTPIFTQGFSPHYDDVDIFIIQCQGSKRWRLYANEKQSDILSYHSSRNFVPNELHDCILDVTLHSGDILYAPRGTIHQCLSNDTLHNEDSLHITLSTCLQSTWYDYFNLILPKSIEYMRDNHVEWRKILPINYYKYMGESASSTLLQPMRDSFVNHFHSLLDTLVTSSSSLPFDEAADEMILNDMHGRVPPVMNLEEKKARERWVKMAKNSNKSGGETGESAMMKILTKNTLIRLVKPNICRITSSAFATPPSSSSSSPPAPPSITLHHILNNSRLFKSAPLSSMEIDIALAPAVEIIIKCYPKYVRIGQLPRPVVEGEEEDGEEDAEGDGDVEDLCHLVAELFDSGIIELSNDQSKYEPNLLKDMEMEEEGDNEGDNEGENDENEEGEGDEEEQEGEDEDEDTMNQ